MPSTPRCFRVHPADNVATLLDDAVAGEAQLVGGETLPIHEPIKLGHKIALSDMAAGQTITKFGVPIGHASRNIGRGEWVHLHNCESNFDTRSGGLDLHTGAATDTKYE
ncbi:MAG: hypothetical protein JWM57_1667 [Phycisphaerales bacterium]|nr:hypothetical protein [Phycisphaerales bacterium]